MDFSIASILLLDGVTNGAVYSLLGLATVLVFTVTRVIFIPQGEFVAYGALTLAILQTGKVPGTVWLLLILAGVASVMELVSRWQHDGNVRNRAQKSKIFFYRYLYQRSILHNLIWLVLVLFLFYHLL